MIGRAPPIFDPLCWRKSTPQSIFPAGQGPGARGGCGSLPGRAFLRIKPRSDFLITRKRAGRQARMCRGRSLPCKLDQNLQVTLDWNHLRLIIRVATWTVSPQNRFQELESRVEGGGLSTVCLSVGKARKKSVAQIRNISPRYVLCEAVRPDKHVLWP